MEHRGRSRSPHRRTPGARPRSRSPKHPSRFDDRQHPQQDPYFMDATQQGGSRPPIAAQTPAMAQQSMSKVTALLDMINTYEPKAADPTQSFSLPPAEPKPKLAANPQGQRMADWTYGSQFQLDESYGHNFDQRARQSTSREQHQVGCKNVACKHFLFVFVHMSLVLKITFK